MKTSIATVSISGNLKEKLTAISEAGFNGIEIFENDFLTFDGSPREVAGMVKDFGLEIEVHDPVARLSSDLNLKIVEDFSRYDVVVLAVPHKEYLDMSFDDLLKDDKSFVFDFKRALPDQDWILIL